jgi:hypothetical protein
MSYFVPGFAATVLGPGFLCIGSWHLYLDLRARWWLKVKGVITGFNTKRKYYKNGIWFFVPCVEFSFNYLNDSFSGKTEVYSTGSLRAAETVQARNPPGTEVDVYFNPNKPRQSTITPPHVTSLTWLCILSGAFFIIVEILALKNVPRF